MEKNQYTNIIPAACIDEKFCFRFTSMKSVQKYLRKLACNETNAVLFSNQLRNNSLEFKLNALFCFELLRNFKLHRPLSND